MTSLHCKDDKKGILPLFSEMLGIYYENDGERSPRFLLTFSSSLFEFVFFWLLSIVSIIGFS